MGILGMQPCEGTEAVPPNARSHTVRGGASVLLALARRFAALDTGTLACCFASRAARLGCWLPCGVVFPLQKGPGTHPACVAPPRLLQCLLRDNIFHNVPIFEPWLPAQASSQTLPPAPKPPTVLSLPP